MISADGHPVRGAFTFAVGPNPGPAPQFVIPSISETAATPRLLVARWLVFLSVMAAIGLFVLRIAIARPLVRRVSGTRLRAVSIAFVVACGDRRSSRRRSTSLLATAQFALRSVWDVGALVPLIRASVVRARLRRPRADVRALRARRRSSRCGSTGPSGSGARSPSCSRSSGALARRRRRAARAGPRRARRADLAARAGRSLFDWSHLPAGSLWFGGLIGLLVLWRACPRRGASQASPSASRASRTSRSSRSRAHRARGRAQRSSICRRSRRSGRRRTARRSS